MNSRPNETVIIDLADRSYPILIGPALLSDPQTFASVPGAATALIVSNTSVAPLYAQRLKSALSARFKQIHVVSLPDGGKRGGQAGDAATNR